MSISALHQTLLMVNSRPIPKALAISHDTTPYLTVYQFSGAVSEFLRIS